MSASQIAAGNRAIVGTMLESFLVGGRQDPGPVSQLVMGSRSPMAVSGGSRPSSCSNRSLRRSAIAARPAEWSWPSWGSG